MRSYVVLKTALRAVFNTYFIFFFAAIQKSLFVKRVKIHLVSTITLSNNSCPFFVQHKPVNDSACIAILVIKKRHHFNLLPSQRSKRSIHHG